MRFSPLVSVLTTVYNREPYIAACIESVLAQTLDNFELIIVDDCSTDNSHVIAEGYRSDPRVRLYRNETNLGDYPNRNRAASLAMGKYLKYVDADDLIYPHCLELMVEGMETFPGAGYGISKEIAGVMAPALLSPREAYRSHFFDTGLFSIGPLDAIIRRDAFESIGGFSPARYTSDTDFFLRIGARWPGIILIPGLGWWRHHAGQESIEECLSSERVLDVTLRRHRNVCEALASPYCPLLPDETLLLRRRASLRMLRMALGQARRGRLRWFARILDSVNCPGVDIKPPGSTHPDTFSQELSAAGEPGQEVSTSLAAPLAIPASTPIPAGLGIFAGDDQPLFSVLIPVLGQDTVTLKRALRSVIAQRFDNWELILVTKGDWEIAPDLLQGLAGNARLQVIRINSVERRWDAYNHAAKQARGAYLKFLEPDEALYPHCLEQAARMMRRHSAAALGVSGPCGPFLSGICLEPLRAIESEFLSTPRFLTGPTGLFCKTEAFRALGGFALDRAPAARHLAVQLASQAPLVLLPDGLVFQRPWRDWYASAKGWSLGRAAGLNWLCEYLRSDECPLSASQREGAIANLRQLGAQALFALLRQGRWHAARAVMRDEGGFGLGDLRLRGAKWNRASDEFYALAQAATLQSLHMASFTGLE